jgi:hypothetical protein
MPILEGVLCDPALLGGGLKFSSTPEGWMNDLREAEFLPYEPWTVPAGVRCAFNSGL